MARAIRRHWSVEIMHWHLDVTFKEDANSTLGKIAVQNLNIINKWCLSILKLFEVGKKKKSLRKKRFHICMNAENILKKYLNCKKIEVWSFDRKIFSCVCRAVWECGLKLIPVDIYYWSFFTAPLFFCYIKKIYNTFYVSKLL